MSSTVLDELVIRLGLDTGPMQATAQKALGTLDQLEQKNTALSKSLIQTGKTATASLSTMRREALGLLGLVSGGRGLGAVLQTLAPNAKQPLKKTLAPKTFAQGLKKQPLPQRQSTRAKRLPAFYTQNFAQSLTRSTALAPVFVKQDPYHTAKPAQQHIMPRLYSGPVLAKKIQTGGGSVKESSFSKNLFFPKNTPALRFTPKQAGHFSPHHFAGRGSQFAALPSPTIVVPGGSVLPHQHPRV
ncbi:putative tail-fiber/lysozyme protein [Acetobacter orientalis]|uniref:Putative tail-fiber/lysozyme protein n=1 Tax=Acetobacter orientalis TaxID=146474 RepID=A0A2Z5ZK49_9PROT|nr:putative tail-fiber/lysozyme protein [Acetobacter orientalis]